jgi:hypothetical protein
VRLNAIFASFLAALILCGCAAREAVPVPPTPVPVRIAGTYEAWYDFEYGYSLTASDGTRFVAVPSSAVAPKFEQFFNQSNLAKLIGTTKRPYCRCQGTVTADGLFTVESAELYFE